MRAGILAVNGTVLVAHGRMAARTPSFHGQIKHLTRIPAGLLKRGGQQLRVSPHTVGTHVKSIYRKLEVNSHSEAVREAFRTGEA